MQEPKHKRIGISKKTRFEVFKRDQFTCQYCGAHPPGVLLQVDHIKAVSVGGTNRMDNLLTSCQPCNIGKGATDLKAVPQSLADKAADVKEREAQIRGYQTIMDKRHDRIEDELWRVAEVVDPGSSESGMDREWIASIRRFNDRLGAHDVLDSADTARVKYPRGGRSTFLYFCGICWNKIRAAQNEGSV